VVGRNDRAPFPPPRIDQLFGWSRIADKQRHRHAIITAPKNHDGLLRLFNTHNLFYFARSLARYHVFLAAPVALVKTMRRLWVGNQRRTAAFVV
jgi:hypothetical protein